MSAAPALRLEESPRLLSYCKRPAGRWGLLAVFALLLSLFGGHWPYIVAFLIGTTAFPARRRWVVTASGILLMLALPNGFDVRALERIAARDHVGLPAPWAMRIMTAAVVLSMTVLAALVFRFPRSRVGRRPVLAAVLGFTVLSVAVSLAPLAGWSRIVGWAALLTAGRMLWFFCYTLADRESRDRDPVGLQVGLWRPLWMANSISTTPFAKGAAYLRKIEARSGEEFAVTQIKAVKLLFWAVILNAAQGGFVLLAHDKLGIPRFESAFARSAAGQPFAWHWNCLSLGAAFLSSLFEMSITGHRIVACARMAGFRALRNTYRPFQSRTIADFWNRFYFYFKELLVDMFFYPTYLRYFKKHPRLRMAAATMMAACAGNAIFHFLRDIGRVGEVGWWRTVTGFQTYLFYCAVLGAGIVISQLRGRRRPDPAQSWLRQRVVPLASVAGFYCLIHIFDDTSGTYGLREHFIFVGRLIGL